MLRSIVVILACLGSLLAYAFSDALSIPNLYGESAEQLSFVDDDGGLDDAVVTSDLLPLSRRFVASDYKFLQPLFSESAPESYLIRAPPFRQNLTFTIA